jgi:hypothetical protein
MTRIITEFMAGGNGMLAEGARANLKAQNQREANRGVRRTMKECIEGLRDKAW